jgi:DNA-binding LytR/AlgR family response regulator
MNWCLIIDDTKCKKELTRFISSNKESIVLKAEMPKGLKSSGEYTKSEDALGSGFIAISSSSTIEVLKIANIVHCRSYENYTQLFLADKRKITSSKSLKDFEESLKARFFIRVHQSHLVNLYYIDKYVRGNGGHLILRDGTQIPVAARKKEYLLRQLEKL